MLADALLRGFSLSGALLLADALLLGQFTSSFIAARLGSIIHYTPTSDANIYERTESATAAFE